jgi:endonuclease YncB( thermonuclease family)
LVFRRVALVSGLIALFAPVANAAGKPACNMTAIGTANVRAVKDGRTLVLGDGREVRLAAIEVARRDGAAVEALRSLVSGKDVELLRLGRDTDRYGRVIAIVTLPGASAQIAQSVQGVLVEQGHARVAARIGGRGCANALLEAERKARAAKLGIWADPAYLVQNAEDSAAILKAKGHFAVVEGRVLSVRQSGATIYVNFSRHWSDDFTVTVPQREERKFAAEGLDLRKLAGRTVRIRGTIEERGGPWIEATAPEQIETTENE